MSEEFDSSDHAQNLKSRNFTENYNILISDSDSEFLFLAHQSNV